MIYHHAVTKAVTEDHVNDLIAQATANRLAEQATTARRGRLGRWARRLGRAERKLTATPITEPAS